MENEYTKDLVLEKLKFETEATRMAWQSRPEQCRTMLLDIYEKHEPHISISKLSFLSGLNERTLIKILYGKKADQIKYKQIIKICIALDLCYEEIIRILNIGGFNLKYPPVEDGYIIDTLLRYREKQKNKMDILTFDFYIQRLGGHSIFSRPL